MRVAECQRRTIPRKFTYSLDLFRPMSFDNIYQLMIVEQRIGFKRDPCYQKYVCVYQILSNMTEVRIRKGSSLLPSSISPCRHSALHWKKPQADLCLEIDSEIPDQDIVASMEIVLDLIKNATDPEERRPLLGKSATKKRLVLGCHPPVFEAFIRVVS